jgi:hypothetical protein
MIWIVELAELLVAVIPLLILVKVWRYKDFSPKSWMIKLLSATFFSLLQIGLLLRRLTASCSMPSPVSCEKDAITVSRVPGVFDFCTYCNSPGTGIENLMNILSMRINQIALPAQAITAGASLLLSLIITISFTRALREALRK